MKIAGVGDRSEKKPSKINIALKTAGFNYIMFDLREFCSGDLLENKEKRYQEYLVNKTSNSENMIFLTEEPYRMEEMVQYHLADMKRQGLKNVIGYAPALPDNTKRNDLDNLIITLTTECFKVCKAAGCEYLIIDPIIKNVRTREELEKNMEFYLLFAKKAEESGLKILIKNKYNILDDRYIAGYMSDAYWLSMCVDELNRKAGADIFAICLDLGVCNILGQNICDIVVELGNRIEAVIFRENDGVSDKSFLPFACVSSEADNMNWLETIKGLRKVRFDGLMIFDFVDQRRQLSHLFWDELTIFARKIVDFLCWQINMENVIRSYNKRVLFGAGNMCRNYMKCYGKDYPPLFTCDNNKNIWGTYFEGLEIKSPEELKNLPDDCAIFICNMYYDEIGEQIKNMGITNPIEYFNDEYMPSSYTDRFDSETRTVK